MKKLGPKLIADIVSDIDRGLTNKEACEVNEVKENTYYKWVRDGKSASSKEVSERTSHEKNCIKLIQSLKKAKARRKQRRIEQLDQSTSVAGIIFLLKNEYPNEFNKQPHLIPNFEKLEEYMQSEYTEAEIQAVRAAILKAEDRRQSEISYDEDALFTDDAEGVDRDTETSEI